MHPHFSRSFVAATAAVLVGTTLIGISLASPVVGAENLATIDYTCAFPGIGNQTIPITVAGTAPTSVSPGQTFSITGVQSTTVLPASVVNSLLSLTSAAQGNVTDFEVDATDATPASINGAATPIPFGPVPLKKNKTATVIAPATPESVGPFTAGSNGTISLFPGDITLVSPLDVGGTTINATIRCTPPSPLPTGSMFTIPIVGAPSVTSSSSTLFTAGSAGTFTVTTSGSPIAALSESGSLPSGVSFTDNGNGTATLSGTPASGSGGVYSLTITAANGVSPNATQPFTLTVDQAPSITSSSSTLFTAGSAGTFTVTTSGFPSDPTLSASGSLPSGVSFTDNGDGTATLSGTPTVAGAFPLEISASSSAGTSSQALDVEVGPVVAGVVEPTSPVFDTNHVPAGPTDGGQTIDIEGLGFGGATPVVDFVNQETGSSVPAGSVTVVGAGAEIEAVTPSGEQYGTNDVVVSVDGIQSELSPTDEYTFLPSVGTTSDTTTGTSPGAGPIGGGNIGTVSGSGFTDPLSGAPSVTGILLVHGSQSVPVTTYDVVSDTRIDLTWPSVNAAGLYHVKVLTSLGSGFDEVSNAYTYEGPLSVTMVTPTAGPLGTGPLIKVLGSGFVPGHMTVTWGADVITDLNCISRKCTFDAPAQDSAGLVSFTLEDESFTSPIETFTFEAAPVILSYSADAGPAAGGTEIDLTGSGFVMGSKVLWGTRLLRPLVASGGDSIEFKTPAGTPGSSVQVSVENAGGTSESFTFTYEGSIGPSVTREDRSVLRPEVETSWWRGP
ncbi:MAG: IPT/TIG domain-containing protein [Acidimicrobiales bacterium]